MLNFNFLRNFFNVKKYTFGNEYHGEFEDHAGEYENIPRLFISDDIQMVRVLHLDALPSDGEVDISYKVIETGELFTWKDDIGYVKSTPYHDPNSIPDKTTDKKLIVDNSAKYPHGGTLSIATIYNVWALRSDLKLINKHNINKSDLVSQNIRYKDMAIIETWFKTNHTSLYNQLKTIMRNRNNYNKEAVNSLNSLGVDIWFDTDKNKIGFKDGDFTVLI